MNIKPGDKLIVTSHYVQKNQIDIFGSMAILTVSEVNVKRNRWIDTNNSLRTISSDLYEPYTPPPMDILEFF